MWIKKSKNLHLLSPDTHGHSTCGERLLVDAQWCRPRRAVTSSLLSSTELPCQRLLPSLALAPLFFLLGSSRADLPHHRFRPTPTVVRRFLARAPPQPRPPPPPRSTGFSRASPWPNQPPPLSVTIGAPLKLRTTHRAPPSDPPPPDSSPR